MLPHRFLKCLLLLLLVSGCPLPTVDLGPGGEPSSGAELLRRVEQAERQVFSLQGDAKLSLQTPKGSGSVSLYVVALHPSMLHFEQYDFFGRPQAIFVTDGEQFSLYQAAESSLIRGPVSATNLSRFLPVVVPPRELTAVLLGRAPRIATEPNRLKFDADLQLFDVTLKQGESEQRMLVQPPSYRVVRSTVTPPSTYALRYEELQAVQGIVFPQRFRMDSASVSLDLRWKELQLNQEVDLSLFALEPPDGVTVVTVDLDGQVVTP